MLDNANSFHNVTVDLTMMCMQDDNHSVTHTHTTLLNRNFRGDMIFPVVPIDYEGFSFPAPQLTEAFLQMCYGYLGRNAVFNRETNLYEPGPASNHTGAKHDTCNKTPACAPA